jgi:hypothetical protein
MGKTGAIFKYLPATNSWTAVFGQLPIDSLSNSPLSVIQPDLWIRGTYVAAIADNSNGPIIVYSTDAGQTWKVSNLANLAAPFGVHVFTDMVKVGNYLIVSSLRGVFISADNGDNWTLWNEGFTEHSISSMAVFDGYLWAGQTSGGIWKRSLTELGMKPISGTVFLDQNGNGLQDSGETGVPNIVVQASGSNSYTNTRSDGTYTLLSNLAQEQINLHLPKAYWMYTPLTQTVGVPANQVNFAVSLDSTARDLSVDLTNTAYFEPGFGNILVLGWHNNVPLPVSGVNVQWTYPTDQIDLLSATPAPTTQSGGLLTWDLGAVGASASGQILLHVKTLATDSIGASICMNATVSPVTGDLYPGDNTAALCARIIGSHDPNDKSVGSDQISPMQLSNQKPLDYTVRFQNTGNFPATEIRILDTLQSNFDPGTFQFLASSHPCRWSIKGNAVVEFDFPNILLPPAGSDEPGSHGFVKYSVQGRPDLPLGTPLRNTAGIFFDFNAPVATNTTETVVQLVKTTEPGAVLHNLQLMPNPASTRIRLQGAEAGVLIVKNAGGHEVLRQNMDATGGWISVEALPAGWYEVMVTGLSGVWVGRVCVVR